MHSRLAPVSRYLTLLLVGIGAIGAVVASKPEPQTELVALAPARVVTTRIETQQLIPEVRLVGQLQPSARAQLHFEQAGTLAERRVEPGASVVAGQPLLRLEDGDQRDALALAEAQLTQEEAAIARDRHLLVLARHNRDLAEAEVTRLDKLSDAALASQSTRGSARQALLALQQEVARLDYSVNTAEARLAQRRAERERAARALARTELRAPFAGRVNRVAAQPGDYMNSNGLALELVALEQLDLYTEVSGEVAAALSLGQRLTVTLDGHELAGELVALQPDPDATTHTHALRIRLPGAGLRPGQLAQVSLHLPARPAAPVVPITALLREDGQAWLYVLEVDRLQRREVQLGRRVDGLMELSGGAAPGETIVARDVAALADGQQVVVVDVAQAE